MTYQEVVKTYLETARDLVRNAENIGCKGEAFDKMIRCLIEVETLVRQFDDIEELSVAVQEAGVYDRLSNHFREALEHHYSKE